VPIAVHVSHAPVQPALQHTPDTQKPDAHCVPALHWPPFAVSG
jgi:hypothetical protein